MARIGKLSNVVSPDTHAEASLAPLNGNLNMSEVMENMKVYSSDPLLWKFVGLVSAAFVILAIILFFMCWLRKAINQRPSLSEAIQSASTTGDKKKTS